MSWLLRSRSCTLLCNRKFSTAIAPNLPPNLKLADMSVLQPEKKIDVSPDVYLFPRINVPSTVPVVKFRANSTSGNNLQPISLNPIIFGTPIRKDIVLDCVRYHRFKSRYPYKTKRKSEIRGSNKKPHPQKGTGRAQAGHKRNAIWRGGHKAHGPVLRDFSINLNRKLRARGMMIALAAKLLEGNFIVVDEFNVPAIKTKEVFLALKAHQLDEKPTLLIDDEFQSEFESSAKNIANVTMLTTKIANVYDIVKMTKLVITVKALESLQNYIMSEYTCQAKKGAYNSTLKEFETIVAKGKAIGPQTGVPFKQLSSNV